MDPSEEKAMALADEEDARRLTRGGGDEAAADVVVACGVDGAGDDNVDAGAAS